MSRFLVTDLDGTYLEEDGSVPFHSDLFLDHAYSCGYEVVFASARSFGNIVSLFNGCRLPRWIISNDGAVIYHKKLGEYQVEKENLVDKDTAANYMSYLEYLDEQPIFFTASNHGNTVFVPCQMPLHDVSAIAMSDTTRSVLYYSDASSVISNYNLRSISLFGSITEPCFQQISSFHSDNTRVIWYPETRFGKNMWLDIISKNTEKYEMSLHIAGLSDITRIHVALGNGPNDLALIKHAVWSAVPSTADYEVKSLSKYIGRSKEGTNFLNEITSVLQVVL